MAMKTFYSLVKQVSENPRNFTALKNLDLMLGNTPFKDSSTSLELIEGLCSIKKLQRAKDVILDMKKNVKVAHYFLYSLVLDGLIKDGDIKNVETFWGEISGESRRIDVSDYVIYLCKFGHVWEIVNIFKRVLMGNCCLREQSYAALIGAFCSKNEGLLAKELLYEMNDKGIEADDITYVVMFQCFCRNGELDDADMILRRLVKRSYKFDICIFGSFIYGLCRSGKMREADKLFRKLLTKDRFNGIQVESLKKGRRAVFQLNFEGAVPEVVAYETYFRSLCSVGRLEEAETVLKEMMKKRSMPEMCVYGSFIKALFKADREGDAIKFYNTEIKKGLVCGDEMARFVIYGLCKNGKVEEALKMYDGIVTRSGFASVLGVGNVILDSYWKQGRVAEAESLFERIKDEDFGASNGLMRYTSMVDGYCKLGEVSKAISMFEEMRSNNIPVNGRLYEMIIRGLRECARLKEADVYLNDMIQNGQLVSYSRWRTLSVTSPKI